MAVMSLTMHFVALTLLVLDLAVGGWAIGRLGGHFAAYGFEFVMIFGYIIFILQWGVPWGERNREDNQSESNPH